MHPQRTDMGAPLKVYNQSSPRYKPSSPSTTIFVAPTKKPENAEPLSEEEEEEKKE
jgi:hypothetical protein